MKTTQRLWSDKNFLVVFREADLSCHVCYHVEDPHVNSPEVGQMSDPHIALFGQYVVKTY